MHLNISDRLNLHNFHVSDSFRDGICCIEGEGSYTISVDNGVIQSGGDFTNDEVSIFQAMECVLDEDCDVDSCLYETCLSHVSVCKNAPKPFEECGAVVSINIMTDQFVGEISWQLIDRDGTVVMADGLYEEAFKACETHQCVSFGNYELSILCIRKHNGICFSYRNHSDNLEYYSLKLGNVTIQEGGE